jgi:choline kinase
MQVCILAAGKGSRLGAAAEKQPKALLPVLNRPLIQYTLDFISQLNPESIIVVGGYGFRLLKEFLQSQENRYPPLVLLRNPQQTPGNLSSLMCALPHLHSSFLLCNADHIYPRTLLEYIPNPPRSIQIFGDTQHPLQADDMKWIATSSGTLAYLSKQATSYDGGYIGLSAIGEEYLATYKRAAEHLRHQTDGMNLAVEQILNQLVKMGESITILPVEGLRGWEIDTPEDLQITEQELNQTDICVE